MSASSSSVQSFTKREHVAPARNLPLIIGIALMILAGVLLFAVTSFQTPSTRPPVTRRMVTRRRVTISPMDSIKYGGAGLHCSVGYLDGEPRMVPSGFCKHFKSGGYYVYLGKYFFQDDNGTVPETKCHLIDEAEQSIGKSTISAWARFLRLFGMRREREEYMEFAPSRFWFANSKKLALRKTCKEVQFTATMTQNLFGKPEEERSERDTFVLARAYVYSSACQAYQFIPALWSEEKKRCIYFDRETEQQDPLMSRDCQVLCDRSDETDIWHKSSQA